MISERGVRIMCEICHGNGMGGHREGCPNKEPETVGTCEWCQEPIASGETVYEFHDDIYHEECFRENAVGILEGLGAMTREA